MITHCLRFHNIGSAEFLLLLCILGLLVVTFISPYFLSLRFIVSQSLHLLKDGLPRDFQTVALYIISTPSNSHCCQAFS